VRREEESEERQDKSSDTMIRGKGRGGKGVEGRLEERDKCKKHTATPVGPSHRTAQHRRGERKREEHSGEEREGRKEVELCLSLLCLPLAVKGFNSDSL
jgi:hypothetical protein